MRKMTDGSYNLIMELRFNTNDVCFGIYQQFFQSLVGFFWYIRRRRQNIICVLEQES
ncbi:hypothetical protein D3C80_2147670 [compost metagenome]